MHSILESKLQKSTFMITYENANQPIWIHMLLLCRKVSRCKLALSLCTGKESQLEMSMLSLQFSYKIVYIQQFIYNNGRTVNMCHTMQDNEDSISGKKTTAESRAPLSLLPLTNASLNSLHFWHALYVKQPTIWNRVNCKGLGLGLHLQVLSSLWNKFLECQGKSNLWNIWVTAILAEIMHFSRPLKICRGTKRTIPSVLLWRCSLCDRKASSL